MIDADLTMLSGSNNDRCQAVIDTDINIPGADLGPRVTGGSQIPTQGP